MSVRKRIWKNAAGEPQEAWIVDYVDQKGKRHIKTFGRKKDADAWHATAKVEVRQGVHTPDSDSLTVEQAGNYWIETGEANGLERSTIADYKKLPAIAYRAVHRPDEAFPAIGAGGSRPRRRTSQRRSIASNGETRTQGLVHADCRQHGTRIHQPQRGP